MTKQITCILCPNGCDMFVTIQENEIVEINGGLCKHGDVFVKQEIFNPMRNIASSVVVLNGELPLASVRLTNNIPKDKIFDVMAQIKAITVNAPVRIGDVVIHNVLKLNTDIVVTKNINAKI